MPNQEPAFAKTFRNGPVRLSTQGLLCLFLKTFAVQFHLPPTDCPWVSEDALAPARLKIMPVLQAIQEFKCLQVCKRPPLQMEFP